MSKLFFLNPTRERTKIFDIKSAVLHLFYAVLAKNNQFQNIKSIYIQSSEKEEIFAEMEDFLKQTNQRYNMDVVQATGDIKSALGELFCTFSRNTLVFIVGTPSCSHEKSLIIVTENHMVI